MHAPRRTLVSFRQTGRQLWAWHPRRSRLRVLLFAVALVIPVAVSGATSVSWASDGTILRTITAQGYSCSVGTGLAFDGTKLLLSCDYDNKITAVKPSDGSFLQSYNIAGIGAIGALAWDRSRGQLWACGGFGGDDTIVYRINLDTQTATKAFGGTQGCPDGLAYDGTDDTLYLSADVANTVQHYKSDGTLIANLDVSGKLGGCGNSGLAVGGQYLFLANDGCSQIYRAPKNDLSSPTLFGSYPARIEDMECDDVTFRIDNKAAIWSKDAYDATLNAFELNTGDCGFGGQPPGGSNADSDGDGIPDSWETNGVDFNGQHLDLNAMGADPQHKDIFIQTDWMVKPPTCIWFICWGGQNFKPSPKALADLVAAFSASPNTNPDGKTGVRLHIDSGPDSIMNPVTGQKWGALSRAHEVPFQASLGNFNGNDYNWSAFDAIRHTNLDAVRAPAFHYILFADTYAGSDSSGISRGVPSSDTIVTDGDPSWGAGFTNIQERGTLMHELGHNLNLRHGGDDDVNHKPNYISIMNYDWQLTGLPPNGSLDYSRGTAGSPFNDWTHLVFNGGSIGSFGASLPATTPADEQNNPATLKAAGVFARAGDGTVQFVGPSMLLPGTGTQQLVLDVTNVGTTPATYTPQVAAPGLAIGNIAPTAITGGGTQRLTAPVDTSHLQPGTYPVNVTLSSDAAGSDLSDARATITVPDLNDPAQLQQARNALAQLRGLGPDSGLDPSTRDSLIQALVAALPWTAHVSMTGSPTGKLDASYTVHAPVFTPDATSRQTIALTSWTGTPSLTVNLNRNQPTSADYKGTLHLQRPDGSVVDGTVNLIWTPDTNTLGGSYKAKTGGGLQIVLTAP